MASNLRPDPGGPEDHSSAAEARTEYWLFQKPEPAPAGPAPPQYTTFPLAGWLLSPEKVHNLNMSSFVSLMFSRMEKRKGREEYKEAIKNTLNKLPWEPGS